MGDFEQKIVLAIVAFLLGLLADVDSSSKCNKW